MWEKRQSQHPRHIHIKIYKLISIIFYSNLTKPAAILNVCSHSSRYFSNQNDPRNVQEQTVKLQTEFLNGSVKHNLQRNNLSSRRTHEEQNSLLDYSLLLRGNLKIFQLLKSQHHDPWQNQAWHGLSEFWQSTYISFVLLLMDQDDRVGPKLGVKNTYSAWGFW